MRSLLLPIAAILLAGVPVFAADAPAAAAKPYPLTTCMVTGDKLDEMGDPVVVVKDGQEWKFCCKKCVKEFDKDPASWQKKLDDVVSKKNAGTGAKAGTAATGDTKHEADGHTHQH